MLEAAAFELGLFHTTAAERARGSGAWADARASSRHAPSGRRSRAAGARELMWCVHQAGGWQAVPLKHFSSHLLERAHLNLADALARYAVLGRKRV